MASVVTQVSADPLPLNSARTLAVRREGTLGFPPSNGKATED